MGTPMQVAALVAASLVQLGSAQCVLPGALPPSTVWNTPLNIDDEGARAFYTGALSYACNHTSGDVTYLQNMSFVFDYSGGENTDTRGDIFRLDFSAPRPACLLARAFAPTRRLRAPHIRAGSPLMGCGPPECRAQSPGR